MFRVTLVNFEAASGRASVEYGSAPGGYLPAPELLELLERFAAVDPIENAEAEPEIGVEVRRRRHVLRTGQGRLFLYDPRNALEPALVLTPQEVLAELDGSAAAARTRAPFPLAATAPTEEPVPANTQPTVSPLRRGHRAALWVLSAACGVCLASSAGLGGNFERPESASTPVTEARRIESTLLGIAGVYMNGSRPGHHGIAVSADGTLKLFQLNRQGAPSLLVDRARFSSLKGELLMLGAEIREPIRLGGKGVLHFCGETYLRVE